MKIHEFHALKPLFNFSKIKPFDKSTCNSTLVEDCWQLNLLPWNVLVHPHCRKSRFHSVFERLKVKKEKRPKNHFILRQYFIILKNGTLTFGTSTVYKYTTKMDFLSYSVFNSSKFLISKTNEPFANWHQTWHFLVNLAIFNLTKLETLSSSCLFFSPWVRMRETRCNQRSLSSPPPTSVGALLLLPCKTPLYVWLSSAKTTPSDLDRDS